MYVHLRQTDLLRGSGGNYRAAQWVLGRSTCAHYVGGLVPGRREIFAMWRSSLRCVGTRENAANYLGGLEGARVPTCT